MTMVEEDPFKTDPWPALRGDYRLGDCYSGVAVLTLASRMDLQGAAIWGPCLTENLGVEKVVANVISNSRIRYLLVCGQESRGHMPGDAIIALHRNGVDDQGRIVGARGAIPFILNLSRPALERFRDQVSLVDRRGLEDPQEIGRIVKELDRLAEVYPQPPMMIPSHRRPRVSRSSQEGDVYLGSDVIMDSSSWVVAV